MGDWYMSAIKIMKKLIVYIGEHKLNTSYDLYTCNDTGLGLLFDPASLFIDIHVYMDLI